jgi:hypothetical protein
MILQVGIGGNSFVLMFLFSFGHANCKSTKIDVIRCGCII